MRIKLAGAAVAVCSLLGLAGSASAHHGFNVEFDGSKCLDLKGTLTGVIWENPHAYLSLDVADASGKTVPWRLEMITPNALKRNPQRAIPAVAGGLDSHECRAALAAPPLNRMRCDP